VKFSTGSDFTIAAGRNVSLCPFGLNNARISEDELFSVYIKYLFPS
jgi:hypothetical protein